MGKGILSTVKGYIGKTLNEPVSWLLGGQGRCLMYHRIVKDPLMSRFEPNSELVVSQENFEIQMRYLSENYQCLDMDTAIRLLKQGRLPKDAAMVTFDDGYRDNLTLAFPILKKYRIPVAIYITTGLMDRTCRLWWYEHEVVLRERNRLELDWKGVHYHWDLGDADKKCRAFSELNVIFKRLPPREQEEFLKLFSTPKETERFYDEEVLSWDEIRQMASEPLVTIGAHTLNHWVLKRLEPDQLRSEIRQSQVRLEEKLGIPIKHFAYPFGGKAQVGDREYECVKELGFESAWTTQPGNLYSFHRDHLFSLPRVSISYYDSLKDFQWKLSGLGSMIRSTAGGFYSE